MLNESEGAFFFAIYERNSYCLGLHSNQEIPHYSCCNMETPCLSLHQSALQNIVLAQTACHSVSILHKRESCAIVEHIKIICDRILLIIKMSNPKNKHIVYSMKT